MTEEQKAAALKVNCRTLMTWMESWNCHPDLKALTLLTVAYGITKERHGAAQARMGVTAFLRSLSEGGDND
ncbi:hypothetical protein CP98_01296 [Sphingobium yanoikuyae]|uniref:Uncharacterized protein n=1 Tax=Sphingobium yanoikuyae TaxID=13690 RepID=A0A084EQ49_SPHYA|nr:hypothetical protein [Sphingobium yanoikuyae]KEZ20091.1 hypothetical protein CP98_01296 [Sphingobium yanoikuyae]